MADKKENQKANEKVKYRFGTSDLNLADYIHNLDSNVQSYLNSRNWNEGQKQEFRNAYQKYLQGLQDQLTNNTGRFSTDSFGTITDNSGLLSNIDNDDIDPVGSEYYYDDKGNRISTDDYNILKNRKQKNYKTFSANREVASFFNKVGSALRDSSKPTSPKSNAFNLSKHGFSENWKSINNPSGGTFDLTPYIEKDPLDETTGKRETSNRAAYLKEQIENYIQNVGDYDFSSTLFKTRDAYLEKLKAAAKSLENGYDSEDVIALNQAGIGNDFLQNFFATEAKEQESDLEKQAREAQERMAKREEEDKLQAIIDTEKDQEYQRQRKQYFEDYIKQNPFTSTIQGQGALSESYSRDAIVDELARRYNTQNITADMVKDYINFPQLLSIIKNKDLSDFSKSHITNRLHLALDSGLLGDPTIDGYYVIPGSENYNNWSFIGYNPQTKKFQDFSMLLNEELAKRMAYGEYDKRNNVSKKENGGTIILQTGGFLNYANQRLQSKAQKEQELKKKQEETGRTKEQIEAGERKISDGLKGEDYARIAAAATDALSAVSSFVPVYGTAASAGLGITSTLTNLGADIADDSVSGWDALKNAGFGLGMDLVGLIPGYGTAGKAAKIARLLKPVAKTAAAAMAVNGLTDSANALGKLFSNPSDLNADDWRNLVTGLQVISGAARYRGGVKAKKKSLENLTTRTPYTSIETKSGNKIKLTPEQFKELKSAKGLEEQNKILARIAPGEALEKEFKTGKFDRIRHLHRNPKTESGIDVSNGKDWTKEEFLPRGYTVRDGKVVPRFLSNDWIATRGVVGNDEWLERMQDKLFGRQRNPLYVAPKPLSKRDLIDQAIQKQFDTNPNFVFRKEGGTLDLAKVKKFQGGGRNTTSTADWYSDMFKQNPMQTWIDSYTLDNYQKFNDLQKSWNNNRIATGYTPGQKRVSFNQGVKDRQLLWDKETGTNQTIWDLQNKKKITQMGNSGDNNLRDSYTGDGYFGEQEFLRHGGTRESWAGKEAELKEFQRKLAEKGLTYTLDEDSGMYLMGELNPENTIENTTNNPATQTEILKEETEPTQKKGGISWLQKLALDPMLKYALPRAIYGDRMNRRITDLAKASVKPLLKDPFEIHRYTRSDLDAEMQGERSYAGITNLARQPFTSDGRLQLAGMLQAEAKGQEARTAGMEKSNQVRRQYDELAWQQEKENASNRYTKAMENRGALWDSDKVKSAFEQAYLSKKHNIQDVFGQQLEYNDKIKQAEKKAWADQFAKSDIHNAVTYSPNDYGANLNDTELGIWNKVINGTKYSELSKDEQKLYDRIALNISNLESQQLRRYYNIPETMWTYNKPKDPWSVKISKKGGAISEKIEIAGIKARTADAERFQRQIKECIDRNEKVLDRLSKSLTFKPSKIK